MGKPRRAIAQWLVVTSFSACGLTISESAKADEGKPPEIELGDGEVAVLGVPKGHTALLFGFGQDVQHHVMTLRRWEAILEHDGSDELKLQLDRPVPYASIWIAVDLSNGLVATTAPEGRPLRELPRPPRQPAESASAVDLPMLMAELLLVRTGGHSGAWGARVGDGGASDVDGLTDGSLRADVSHMLSIGDSDPPPTELATGDLLVVVDPQQLGYSITTVGSKGGQP